MSSSQTTTTTNGADLERVVDALRTHDRFIVTTHENPDGDALGSLLAMTLALRELGKDATMYLFGEVPIPNEYEFMDFAGIVRGPNPDSSEEVVVALDCANERRLGPESALLEKAKLVVDIDHHHDNTRFGKVNLIVGHASSTGEILADVFHELGVGLTPAIAEALYIAVVTDTGRFQYANTTAKALRLAAEVVEGGRVVVSHLEREDFDAAGAEEPYSEGIIDYLRAVEGAELAALIREPPTANGPTHRISLRTTEEALDRSEERRVGKECRSRWSP